MSERIDVVAWDVDNTAYDHLTKTIPSKEALNALEVPSIPATARNLPLMRKIAQHGVRLVDLGSLDSGATAVDLATEEVVWKNWLERDTVTEIMRKAGRKCIEISTSTLEARIKTDPASIDTRFNYPEESPSVFGVYPLEEGPWLEELFESMNEVQARFMRYENSETLGCFQITVNGINKGTGIAKVFELAGLSDGKAVGIGDDISGDGPLFDAIHAMRQRGITVAMGNADPLLKAKADLVVPSVSDTPDGLTYALRHFNLVE
ncbi:MAG TPA: HAD family hydrolase [Candidatus Saccharimonadales bacterium]|nr:HAD family hydrolase [Candidatus Saccharimonadales bacterium]